jgi:hypothetical protein
LHRACTLDSLIAHYCCVHAVTEADLASPSRMRRHARIRAEIAKSAVEQGIATVTDVAKRFNRSTAAISRLVCELRRRETAANKLNI